MHIEAQYSADLEDSVESDVAQIRIGDGVFSGEQCLGNVHLDVFERFHTCAQQIEDAQSGAHLFALMKKCILQASVSHQKLLPSLHAPPISCYLQKLLRQHVKLTPALI